MAEPADRATASSFPDILSPELALVDPELRTVARAQLADPGRALSGSVRAVEPARAPRRRGERRRRRAQLVALGAATAAAATVALLVADRRPDDAPRTAATSAAGPGIESQVVGSKRVAAAEPAAPRRFAWAPVAGASGYHVELHRGATRIFVARTTPPAITIPAEWTLGQRRYRLEAGEYRWYVWPMISGTRAAEAVVQARLAVGGR